MSRTEVVYIERQMRRDVYLTYVVHGRTGYGTRCGVVVDPLTAPPARLRPRCQVLGT